MTDQQEISGPVDNSHRDAGIAAREANKTPASEPTPKPSAEAKEKEAEAKVEHDDTQNDPEGTAASENNDPSKPKNRGVGKRIDELTKARYDAERERDYWRQQAQRQQQPPAQPAAQQEHQQEGVKTLADFNFDMDAYTRHQFAQLRQQERAESEQNEAQRQRGERQRAFQAKQADFAAQNPDYFDAIANPSLPITESMLELILEADEAPALAYHLAMNPAEAAQIAQMTPTQQARAMGRLEAKLSAPPAASEPPPPAAPPKTASKAPPPPTQLSGAPAVRKSVDDMSMAEYDAMRRKERSEKGLSP